MSGLGTSYLDPVYKGIFGSIPLDLISSEKAKAILDSDPRAVKAGPLPVSEEEWLLCLCEIACRTYFMPEQNELGAKLQAQALRLINEPLGVNPEHEFHTAEAEAILHEYEVNGKKIDEIIAMYKRNYPDQKPA